MLHKYKITKRKYNMKEQLFKEMSRVTIVYVEQYIRMIMKRFNVTRQDYINNKVKLNAYLLPGLKATLELHFGKEDSLWYLSIVKDNDVLDIIR